MKNKAGTQQVSKTKFALSLLLLVSLYVVTQWLRVNAIEDFGEERHLELIDSQTRNSRESPFTTRSKGQTIYRAVFKAKDRTTQVYWFKTARRRSRIIQVYQETNEVDK